MDPQNQNPNPNPTPNPSINPNAYNSSSSAMPNPAPTNSFIPNQPTQPMSAGPAPMPAQNQQTFGPYTPAGPNQPLQPMQPAFGAGQPPMGMPTDSNDIKGKKRRWILPVAIAAVVLMGAGGYVFGYYMPNQPTGMYKRGLENSGKAVDAIVGYATALENKDYKSYDFNGKLKVKSSFSADATIKGSYDEKANATVAIKADIVGQQVTADIRSVHAPDNDSPDVYVRVSGIKSALQSYGADYLTSLDSQWISIDHTLIDSASSSVAESDVLAKTPTNEQVSDAISKGQTVNKKYIFTTDKDTAVLKNPVFKGKETKDGRPTNHYVVGYDKSHLAAYVDAMASALDKSKLNDWSKSANDGKNLSKYMDLAELKKDVNKSKGTMTLDLWIDTDTKLVHALRIKDTDEKIAYTLAQNYTGGDTYPFALTLDGIESDAGKQMTMKLAMNKKTDKVSGQMTINMDGTKGSFDFDVTPSSKGLNVTAPNGAQSINSIMDLLGLNTSSLESDTSLSDDSFLDDSGLSVNGDDGSDFLSEL